MKKFEFKLQKLLEIRQKKEEQEKLELGKASGAYQFELNKKDKILGNVRHVREDLAKNKANLNLSQLKSYDKLIKDSDLAVKKLDIVIEEKRVIMQEHIDKYSVLKRDRRAVEILKEKAQKRYEKEADLEEQKEMDEIGKNIFLKNKESGLNAENE